jgi:hypothetical protein
MKKSSRCIQQKVYAVCTGPITIEDLNNNINESTERVNKIMRGFTHHSIQKRTGLIFIIVYPSKY